MSRRGRLLVSSRHTYAARVPSVLSVMEDVLSQRGVAAAVAPTMTDRAENISIVPIDTATENDSTITPTEFFSVYSAPTEFHTGHDYSAAENAIPTEFRSHWDCVGSNASHPDLASSSADENTTPTEFLTEYSAAEVTTASNVRQDWATDSSAPLTKFHSDSMVSNTTATEFRSKSAADSTAPAEYRHVSVDTNTSATGVCSGDSAAVWKPLPSGGPTTTTAIAMLYRDTTVAVISERSRHCGEPTTAILHHDLVALSVFSELAQDGDTAKAVIPALPQHGASTAAAANSTAVSKHSRMGRGESITATVDPDKSVSGAISRLVKTNRATSTNTTAPTYRDTAAAAVIPELTQTGASTAAVAVDSDKAAAGHDTPAKGKAECNPTTRLGDTNKCRRGRDRYLLPPAMVGSENQPAREGTTNATSGNAFSRGLNSSGSSATTPPSHGRNKPASVSSAPNTSNRGREPTVPESSADNAFRRGRIQPVPEVNNSHHHSQQALIALRPNAPMVLVIYRSESPPPKSLRRNIETSVDAVAGGARLGFLGVGEAFSHASTTRGGEEWARWRELEHHLSRLLLAGEEVEGKGRGGHMPDHPEKPTEIKGLLGADAASF